MEITALSREDFLKLAETLKFKAIKTEHLEKDIADGFKLNADGTINLFNYAAWVLAQGGRTDR